MMVGDGRAAGGWDDPVSFAGVVLSLRLAPICGDVISCRTMSEAIRAKLVLRKRGPDPVSYTHLTLPTTPYV